MVLNTYREVKKIKTICLGFLICLISLYLMIGLPGTSLYTLGGLLFWLGALLSLIGIIKK